MSSVTAATPSNQPAINAAPVLCVDLDGTLIRTDLLWECVLSLLKLRPLTLFLLPIWLLGGKPPVAGHNAAGAALALAAFGSLVYSGVRGSRFAWLGVSFVIAYSIYGVKQAENFEYWPYRGWGARAFAIFGHGWSFWYTVLYSLVMTVFGIQAAKRWGFDKGDRFQIWRYASLIGFQWLFFFLIPEFLFQWAVKYQWVGHKLATDPNFAGQAWRSYGIIYAWPLFFYTFFGGPSQVWIVWGALLTFVIIPILVLFHGSDTAPGSADAAGWRKRWATGGAISRRRATRRDSGSQ